MNERSATSNTGAGIPTNLGTAPGNSGPANAPSATAPDLRPPTLFGRHVYLRALTPGDYEYLQLIETSSELAPRWRLRGTTMNFQEWSQNLWGGVFAQFLVLTKSDNPTRIGLVTAHQANTRDRYARVSALAFNARSPQPLMLIGFGLFLDYVFGCWDLRKLYMDVPAWSYKQFSSGLDRYFTVEGHYRDHHYLAGEFWDQYVLAIYRDDWIKRRTPAAKPPGSA